MRSSRVKITRSKGRMVPYMSNSRIMATFLVLSSLYGLCLAEKEFIFNKANLWDNESSSEGGFGWSSKDEGSALLCGEHVIGSHPLKPMDTKDAKKIFVEIEYKIAQNFSTSGGLFLLSNLLVSGSTSDTRNKDILVSNSMSENNTKATLHYDVKKGDHSVNLTLHGYKICVKVFKVTVYYYVCPKNDALMVTRTAAPRTGFIEASTNCSIKQSGKKGSVVVAKCGSDGEWRKVVDKEGGCTNDCDPGTELINDTCTGCKENFYKETRGTHACIPCPHNTVSENSRTRCECKKRHYRNTENGPCQTIPPKPVDLRYTQDPFNTIKLYWNMSQTVDVNHTSLKFRVKCKQYFGISVQVPCRNLSLGARGQNVTSSPLEVKNLFNNTNYTFSVTALNEVSSRFKEEEWKAATIAVYLQGNIVQATLPQTDPPRTSTPPSSTPKSKAEGSTIPVHVSTINLVTSTVEQGTVLAKEDKTTAFPTTYIGIAIGAIFIILLAVAFMFYKRRNMKKKTLDIEEGFIMGHCPQAYVDPNKYGNPEKAVKKFAKEIDRREIKLEGIIGEGEFAKVHKGMLCRPNEPPVPVALKVLKPGSTAKNREDFLTEAAVMGQFKDMNIVALEGVVTISRPVMIITEFMHNGALSNYLVQRKNRFTESELLGMARGIASGMKYLAKMRFVHRDLAARNVLVNENMVCKVADFGLTRELEESCQGEYVTQGGKIPIRWTAPEAYKHRRFTTASDVWSFGIVLWEIMSYAERPYGDWDNYMVMDQVTANYRLFAPTNCPKIVHQLMMECWKADRTQRPAFSDIVEMLERWIRNPYLLKDYQYVTEKDRMADRKSCVAKSIRDYLEAIKMDRYIDNFIDFGYTELYQIQNLTDDDLVGIGVPLVGHRNKIIKSLRGERELLLPVDV